MTQPKAVSRRTPSPINAKLDRRLAAYVAVASAAGIGMLAAPKVAEGEVVYTPANVSFQDTGKVTIDLNNDGIPDFEVLRRQCGSSHSNCIVLNPLAAGNGFRPGGAIASEVAAGFFGVPVGPGEKFLTGDGTPSYGNVMIAAGAYGPYSWSNGPWAHSTNRYLGLRFTINGQTHYGWARLSINDLHGPSVLTGYAYETIPNTKIIEGELHGAAVSNAQSGNLGALARGAK
jgi:hypothetical protein